MDLGLTGSKAVVTGGSKGMGLAIAQTFAAEGASVAVMARNRAALDAAVESLREAGAPDAVGIGVDMADAASITAGFDAVAERWGQLNSLVHTIGPGDGYFEQMDAYTASKAALSSVTKNLSKSLAPSGILVNCVCPGTIVTASFTEALKDVLAADGLDATDPHDVMTWIDNNFHQPCDLGRAGLPEEIASITVYLASRRNGYVTGATVNVDGGSDFV